MGLDKKYVRVGKISINSLCLLIEYIVSILLIFHVFELDFASANVRYYTYFSFTNNAIDVNSIFMEFGFLLLVGYQIYYGIEAMSEEEGRDSHTIIPFFDSPWQISIIPGALLLFRMGSKIAYGYGVIPASFSLDALEVLAAAWMYWASMRHDFQTAEENTELPPVNGYEYWFVRFPLKIILICSVFDLAASFFQLFIWLENPNIGWSADRISAIVFGLITLLVVVCNLLRGGDWGYGFLFAFLSVILAFAHATESDVFWQVVLGCAGFDLLASVVMFLSFAKLQAWALSTTQFWRSPPKEKDL